MSIGDVIRKYRKKRNITQDALADALGITAPSVNKWENGHSNPDIMLLAPIARLLNITLDTLLSFQKELTVEESNNIINEINEKFRNEPYDDVFTWAKEQLQLYPNCSMLTWQIAVMLDSHRLSETITNPNMYDDYINSCYTRALDNDDESIRYSAANSLFNFYFTRVKYEDAKKYLNYLSTQNPERKRKQALIYSKTKKINEAYTEYEELLFSSYQTINTVFQSLYMLAIENKEIQKANFYVEKQHDLASLFEMGTYYKASCKLDLATATKDIDTTIDIMEQMVISINSIYNFTQSPLYTHMKFKEPSKEFISIMREDLIACFKDTASYEYMKNSQQWKELVNQSHTW